VHRVRSRERAHRALFLVVRSAGQDRGGRRDRERPTLSAFSRDHEGGRAVREFGITASVILLGGIVAFVVSPSQLGGSLVALAGVAILSNHLKIDGQMSSLKE
jgi:hypothetical protein